MEVINSSRLRKRGDGIKGVQLTERSKRDPSSPKGEQSSEMAAAGTSRILRYVLFGFFVGLAVESDYCPS